jgi:hypothetical protein
MSSMILIRTIARVINGLTQLKNDFRRQHLLFLEVDKNHLSLLKYLAILQARQLTSVWPILAHKGPPYATHNGFSGTCLPLC